MSFLSRPKHVVSALARGLDGAAAGVGRLGVGAFGWPLVIGMGLGAGLFAIWEPAFAEAWLARRATMDWMRPVLEAVAVCTLATAATALGIALVRRRRGAPSFAETYLGVLRRGAFLAALPLVVATWGHVGADREWFTLTLMLAVAALVSYSAYHFLAGRAAASSNGIVGRMIAMSTIALAAITYAVQAARIGVANHLRFNTGRADLGIYVSRFREASEGRLFACTLCSSGRHPYSHFEPIVALLSPLYLVHPAAQTLIVLQCVVVASGAVPVYLFARRHVSTWSAAALALAYLAYPPLSEVALFDFHALALAIPVLLWLLLALQTGALRAYWVLAVVLLLLREDMGFVLACVALHVLATETSRRRVAVGTLALSAVALVVGHFAASEGVTQVFGDVVSSFTVGPRRAPRPVLVSELPRALVERALSENKALQLAELLVPLLALPLVGRGRLLLLYGGVMGVFAAATFSASPHAHELALLIPFLFVITATALERIRRGEIGPAKLSGDALSSALALGVLVCSALGAVALGGLGKNLDFMAGPRKLRADPSDDQVALDATLRKLSVSWPRGTKVAASSALLPHLGGASRLYTLDDRAQSDYVVASMKQRPVMRRLDAEESSRELERTGSYGDVRVYRARYHEPLSRRERQLEDE